ncbi:MAG TPA: DUF92 domain-containing protein [Candidatus Poseidoniales archaeon]|jgi:uncharacterized protein (TIGR00297 family)|nr:MAG: hypothetical protein CXT66_00180 [Euryarchaeota archaeon]HIG34006.1 DUF92 domain-containing protein [Candidatus Poseidoniales archaeon]HIL67516.1 DUF92 domain-containing protein [Candidatus Poseidoniales archaeon]
MVELGVDLAISLALVSGLLLISMMKDLLDKGGLLAALVVGLTISLLGHWTWLVVLMTFLIVGSMATKWRFDEKALISAEEANDGVRGWKNVLANGGIASIVAIGHYLVGGHEWSYFLLCSAVSVAASDTLASEIGSLDPRTRIITTLEAVPAGTNGGMSPTGTLAAFYGALLIAVVSSIMGAINGDRLPLEIFFPAVILFGWLGCQVDSILGAILENRGFLGKHSVNFISTLSGSLMALFVATRFL